MSIPNKQVGWSQESSLLWNISKLLENLQGGLGTFTNMVPNTRNITINGVTQDLSADRVWTVLGTALGVVPSYSFLPVAPSVPGEFYWAENSEGTQWLPGGIGGNYYNAGLYYSNGVDWTYMETPYQATQAEVDAGVNFNKFLTPLTFENAAKWDTKQNNLTLTTVGSSGPATLIGDTLNIPQYTSGGGGGQTENFSWKFSTSTLAADPGVGNFRFDNATLASVTNIYIDNITDNSGFDISNIFNSITGNWEFYIQDTDDATKYSLFATVAENFVNNGGWWTIPVTFVSGSVLPGNNQRCTFLLINKNNVLIDPVPTDGSPNSVASNGVWDELSIVQSTGILWGGALSVNADPTKFNIAAGEGYIVNNTDFSNVTRERITWAASLGNVVTNIGTQSVTYVFVNPDGTLHQQGTYPSDVERRAKIFIGRLNHSNLTTVTFTDTFPDILHSPVAQYFDLTNAIGAFSYNGNIISANGANLSIDKTVGRMFNASFNYLPNNQSPNTLNNPGLVLASFRHQNRNSTDGSNVTVIDPTNYDVANVTTPVPNPPATATAMRVYLFPSNTIRIQRGQALYDNLAAAISGYKGETFVENPANTGIAVWIATICIQKNCTSLLDTTTSRIIIEPKFGGSAGAAGVSTGTFQTIYNNSVQPQAITDAIRGAILYQNGLADNTTDVFGIRNFSGTLTWRVTGEGKLYISSETVDVSTQINTPQITIVTAISIDTTTTVSGLSQKGRNVVISNGANAINYTINATDGFAASFVKHGTAAITFVAGGGRTLVQVDGTAILNGAVGSTATISSVGTVDYLRISNA